MIGRVWLYGLAGAALLAAGIGAWVKVSGWRQDSERLPVVEAERDAYAGQRDLAERSLVGQAARNQEIEREFNDALVRAGGAARDLAGQLLDYQARLRRSERAAAATASDRDAARAESDHWRKVEEATRDHFGACSDDAVALTAAQSYIGSLPGRCLPE